MAKAVLFVPRVEMIIQAEKVARNYRLDFLYMKTINSTDSAIEAGLAISDGAELIIARGLTAMEIKKVVTVPVVEITLTGQELGQLVLQTRRELGIVRPKIGLVGFRNMFCDMSSFDALYEIELHEYFTEDYNQLEKATRQAYAEGMDAIIGGEVVCDCAKKMGRPAFFLVSGEESIAEAFRVAEQVAYAIDLEKKNTMLFKTLLDYSFNGIIKINRDGEIEHVNHLVERLLGISEREMQGKKVTHLMPAVDENLLNQVLRQGEEIFSTVLTINKTALVTNIVPLVFENEIQGAIISFHEGKKITEMEAEMRREMYRAGHVAQYTFDTIVAVSGQARETMELAKTYAKFNAPVLILGENGTEKEMLAQCIHNASVCSGDPFVSISCDSLPPDDLCEWIFGTERLGATPFAPKGLVDMAEGGVLFLDNISRLNDYTQYRLYRLVSSKAVIRSGDTRPQPSHVRVIAADRNDLIDLVKQGIFREDLYYALNVLSLPIAPLRQRGEDTAKWIEIFIGEMEKKYDRFIQLTSGAVKVVEQISWDGNLPQIKSFCERLVILSPRRTVDEATVKRLLQQSEAAVLQGKSTNPISATISGKMDKRIVELLHQYRGNRRLVAQELDISTTTLWRYMKRYGIKDK